MPNVSGIDHAIGYAALANGSIDVKDAYSTDAKIQENDLVVLRDDLHFFPEYKAVFLYRLELDPRAIDALNHFGRIDEEKMTSLNAAAERTKDYAYAASLYFHSAPNDAAPRRDLGPKLARWISRHLATRGHLASALRADRLAAGHRRQSRRRPLVRRFSPSSG